MQSNTSLTFWIFEFTSFKDLGRPIVAPLTAKIWLVLLVILLLMASISFLCRTKISLASWRIWASFPWRILTPDLSAHNTASCNCGWVTTPATSASARCFCVPIRVSKISRSALTDSNSSGRISFSSLQARTICTTCYASSNNYLWTKLELTLVISNTPWPGSAPSGNSIAFICWNSSRDCSILLWYSWIYTGSAVKQVNLIQLLRLPFKTNFWAGNGLCNAFAEYMKPFC